MNVESVYGEEDSVLVLLLCSLKQPCLIRGRNPIRR